MDIINIHEAKTNLSRLVEKAAKGEPFLIAKAGKPMVKVTAVDAPRTKKRLGFMPAASVPEDFNRMGEAEVAELFGCEPL
jgi:prevent-host-death family protein